MRLEDAHASVANAYLPGVADTHLDRTVDVFAGKCSGLFLTSRIANSITPHQASLQLLKRQLLGMSTPTAPPAHIKTRFLILSDTHSAEPSQNLGNGNVSFRPPVPRADVLLHCGDLTMIGHLEEYEKTLGMLESIEADLKLVIAGNHDITLDDKYYARKGQHMHRADGYDKELPAKAKEMWMGERAKRAGVTYLEEGTYAFKLKNGANLRVCTSFHIPRSLRLTAEGLRISVPARILRLGVSLLP
jgi:hypothetical protein